MNDQSVTTTEGFCFLFSVLRAAESVEWMVFMSVEPQTPLCIRTAAKSVRVGAL